MSLPLTHSIAWNASLQARYRCKAIISTEQHCPVQSWRAKQSEAVNVSVQGQLTNGGNQGSAVGACQAAQVPWLAA